jgi:hypothetical protein
LNKDEIHENQSRISPPLPELLLIAKSSRWVVHRYACNTDTFQIQVVKAWGDWIGVYSINGGAEKTARSSESKRTCVFDLVIHKTIRESLAHHSCVTELRDE